MRRVIIWTTVLAATASTVSLELCVKRVRKKLINPVFFLMEIFDKERFCWFSWQCHPNGLFPPTETETETDPCTESFPDRYIVLCRTFSTGTEMETEMETEIFPDGYCTHFRDGSPSQGHISVPVLLDILIRGLESVSVPVGKPA